MIEMQVLKIVMCYKFEILTFILKNWHLAIYIIFSLIRFDQFHQKN